MCILMTQPPVFWYILYGMEYHGISQPVAAVAFWNRLETVNAGFMLLPEVLKGGQGETLKHIKTYYNMNKPEQSHVATTCQDCDFEAISGWLKCLLGARLLSTVDEGQNEGVIVWNCTIWYKVIFIDILLYFLDFFLIMNNWHCLTTIWRPDSAWAARQDAGVEDREDHSAVWWIKGKTRLFPGLISENLVVACDCTWLFWILFTIWYYMLVQNDTHNFDAVL